MSFIPYPEEEKRKSTLLLQAAMPRAEGQEEAAASRFAEAALEEALARRADAEGNAPRAIRSHCRAASAWANAGDFHHALTLLQNLEQRPDAPEPLKARAFAETARVQLRNWHNTLQEANLSV